MQDEWAQPGLEDRLAICPDSSDLSRARRKRARWDTGEEGGRVGGEGARGGVAEGNAE